MNFNLILVALYGITLGILFNVIIKRLRKFKEKISKITFSEFDTYKTGSQLVDVRTKNEFKKSRILGARNIPISEFNNIETKLLKNKPVLVYCQSGNRAYRAAKKLANSDYTNIIVVKDKLENYQGKTTTS